MWVTFKVMILSFKKKKKKKSDMTKDSVKTFQKNILFGGSNTENQEYGLCFVS